MSRRFLVSALLAVSLLAVQADAQGAPPVAPPPSGHMRPFLDPLGRLWEVPGRDGLDLWFAATDLNGDGQIDRAEITKAANDWFARLDVNGDGVIDPDEETAYEADRSGNRGQGPAPIGDVATVGHAPAPGGPSRRRGRGMGDVDISGSRTGALMDVSNPVVSADVNLDRGVSRAEAVAAATRRLALLDTDGDGKLSHAEAVDRRDAQADYRRSRVHKDNTPPIEQQRGGDD